MSSYVFIDSRVRNYDLLLTSLVPDAQVVILNPAQDGVAQIAQALEGVTDLDAIHIISHGSEGTLYLGDTVLTSDNLAEYPSELETIGAALKETGDILLYGCEVANGVTGQSFIENLALYTDADVAASTDITGSATLNGDWVLEAITGTIEAQTIVSTDFESLLASPTLTVAGTLDTSFDGDGKSTDIGPNTSYAKSLVLQADGKIVVAGTSDNGPFFSDFALVRYNPDGSLDSAFDDDGVVITDFGTRGDGINDVELQVDGRIVVAGTSNSGSDLDFALARYNTDGSLDTTFGAGGMRLDAIGTNNDQINGMVLQPNGKIVVAGYSWNGVNNDFALARYNTDGNLDTTFGTGGKLTTGIGINNDEINSVVLQADGKIVVVGYSWNGTNNDFAVARYDTDGNLDSTFDSDGMLTTDLGSNSDLAKSVAIQSDGKIVVAGHGWVANLDFALVRYNTNGSLDTTFGVDGKVITVFGPNDDLAESLVIQPDGKIVVAGHSLSGLNLEYALARYNINGSLDTTFDGDGKFTTSVGAQYIAGNGVLVQSDGAIIAAGYSTDTLSNTDFSVVRVVGGPGIPDVIVAQHGPFSFTFNANTFNDPDGQALTYATNALPSWLNFDAATRTFSGTPGSGDVGDVNVTVTASDPIPLSTSDSFVLTVQTNELPAVNLLLPDPSFDGDGKLFTPIGTGQDTIKSIALQADGKIMVAGYSWNGTTNDFALARYSASGTLDTAFDTDGKVTTDIGPDSSIAESLVIQLDGKIVAAGYTSDGADDNDFVLARYNLDGSLDSTFDADGRVTTDINETYDFAKSVAIQSDGKIVVAGYIIGLTYDFAITRYNANGNLDTTFDTDGKVITDINTTHDYASSLALQPDGKIVVGGSSQNTTDFTYDFTLARYNTNGSLDSTFDGDGKLTTAVGINNDQINSVVLQGDGKIVVAGQSWNGTNYDFALARYNTNGSLDSTFDGDGKIATAIGAGNDTAFSIAIQHDGKIVVAGNAVSLARYNTDGSLDTTLDGDGKYTVSIGGAVGIAAHDFALQSDGSIVVGGTSDGDFALLRLTSFVPDQSASEDSLFISGIDANTFIDPEGSLITYSASRADGSALPSWLSFDTSSRTFSGTPLNADVGLLSVRLTAADNWKATNSTTFTISVANTNDEPVLANSISGKSVFITSTFNFTVPVNTFSDVDVGDLLTYSATKSDGFALPAWLTFDSATRKFTGTPPPEEAGSSYSIKVIATDSSNASAFTTFALQVNGSYIPGTDGVDDSLEGTPDNDIIDGKTGADTMTGGAGDDTYIVESASDSVIEFNQSSGGFDTVWSSVNYTLPGSVENLLLTGSAGINGTGNNLINQISGNSGNNRVDGGQGDDFLSGGDGNDTYTVDNVNDLIVEGLNAGKDAIESSVSYDISATSSVGSPNVEEITLTGSGNTNATGNTLANIIIGNPGNNNLTGGEGNDTLNGFGGNDTLDGGTGADSMTGGTGDDTYLVDSADDQVIELVNEGTDSVLSSITRTLTGTQGANIEHLTLTGVAVINGTGNTLANQITGNSQNNILDGGSGSVNDTLIGGDGNDTLISAGGNDSLDGGAGNDFLNSGAGNDTLRGGTGTDTMDGGSGNDVYHVDTASDVVIDSDGTADQVVIAVNFTTEPEVFQLYAGIERVSVFDVNAFVLVTGNDLDNLFEGANGDDSLNGAAGNDTLNGALGDDTLDGGSGTDTMKGGAGNDLYYVDNVLDVVEETDVAPGALIAVIALVDGFIDTVISAVDRTLDGLVENLMLTGNAITGIGNELKNIIVGNTQNNILTGNLDDDTLDGGVGTDIAVYSGNSSDYQVTTIGIVTTVTDLNTATVDEGTDTLTYIETIRFADIDIAVSNGLIGGVGDDSLMGGTGADSISGNAGNDTLNGGDGNDTLNGGTGTDIASYAGATSAVTVTLASTSAQNTIGAGTDTLSNLENLTGSSHNDTLTGGTIANLLKGELGHDNLNGGLGNDTLEGGDGDDTLTGSTGDDSLAGGAGVDWAYYNGAGSAVTINLTTTAAQNTGGAGTDTLTTIEHLLGSNYNDTLSGNSAGNQLDGGAGNDTIDGGTGNDTLKGGSGNDAYIVNAAGDVVIENAGAGTDSVQSSVTHTLAANVEHLTLTGVGNASGNGNSLANQLTGNSGNNTLNGGLGNDTMTGGLGNDTYVVNAAGDQVTEAAAAGTDLVQASTSHTLQANVENLILTGAGNSSGNGNTQDNLLTGNSKNNALNGGSGNDTMVGGAGNDTYSVNAAGDVVTEAADQGTDMVNTAISYTLTVNVENLTQTGSANTSGTGNTLDNKLTGNGGNNTLTGNDGADTIIGGSGNDTLTGGTGIDTFDYNALTDAADSITDFTTGAGGDKLDIDTLLTVLGYGGADPIAAGYVQLLQAGAHTQVNIDSNGGGDNFATTLVTLQNITVGSVTLADNFIV